MAGRENAACDELSRIEVGDQLVADLGLEEQRAEVRLKKVSAKRISWGRS